MTSEDCRDILDYITSFDKLEEREGIQEQIKTLYTEEERLELTKYCIQKRRESHSNFRLWTILVQTENRFF